jgi:hypothetical protein
MVDIDIEELSFGGSGASNQKMSRHASPHNTYGLARIRMAEVCRPTSSEIARRIYVLGACCGFCPSHFAAAEDRRMTRIKLKHAFDTIDEDHSGACGALRASDVCARSLGRARRAMTNPGAYYC